MPWCIHHPDVQVVTDFRGVPTCHRCVAESRAAFDRRCRVCMAPVATPGLCPSCAATAAGRDRAEWVGRHALVLVLLAGALGLWMSWPTIQAFACHVARGQDRGDPCFRPNPPADCSAYAQQCAAIFQEERDEADRRAAERRER
jgi:hypothetical protein